MKSDWSNAWQESAVSCAREVPSKIDALLAARDGLLAGVRLPVTATQEDQMNQVAKLVHLILTTHGKDLAFIFAPDAGEKIESAHRLVELLVMYRGIEKQLSAPYAPEAARIINLKQVALDWRKKEP